MEKIRKIILTSIASLFISVAIFNAVVYELNTGHSTTGLVLLIILFLLIEFAILKTHEKHNINELIVPLGAAIVISLVVGSTYASMLAGKHASNKIQYTPEKTTSNNNIN